MCMLELAASFIYSRDNQNCFFIDCYRTDPVRPFISGHVANSMAAEVIALLHSLLTAPETHTAQLWSSAVEIVSTGKTGIPALLYFL